MIRSRSVPPWHRDVVWAVGSLAVVATFAACSAFVWWRASSVRHGPDLVAATLTVQIDGVGHGVTAAGLSSSDRDAQAGVLGASWWEGASRTRPEPWWSTVDASAWGDPTRLERAGSEEEAIRVLAAEAWRVGSAHVASTIGDRNVVAVLEATAPLLDAVSYRSHGRALRLWVSSAVLATIAATVVASLTRGPGRLFRLGSVAILGASLGAVAAGTWWWRLGGWSLASVATVATESPARELWLIFWSLVAVPSELLAEAVRVHAAVVGAGILAWVVATIDLLDPHDRPRGGRRGRTRF